MILLLLPGPFSIGSASVQAALRPAEPGSATIYDAAGKGIGCQAGTRRYRGPGLPKDPPWPPGAEPTPTPQPAPTPTPRPSVDSSAIADPAIADPSTDPEATLTAFVQADLGAETVVPTKPKSKLIPGIDVSHHNGDIDYEAVKDAGHRFVFIKATQDNGFLDPMFPTNMTRARAAGLAAGAYHFFDYTLDGTEQADHFIDRVEAADGIDGALPPVVDVECWGPIGSSIHAVSAARLRDFVERIYERTGRMPIVYTSQHMWREVVGDAEGFEDLPLWAACWGCDAPPSLATGWNEWTFWQDGLARIPEVGRLDGNYFSGSKKELMALVLRPFAIADGAVATGGGRVELDLGGREATHIRTSPDGVTWSEWSRIRATPTAVIPSDEGEHRVYAQLRNGSGLKSPVISDSVVVDRTPPEISVPNVTLRTGPAIADATGIPVEVRWEARDATAGLADASVAVSCGESQSVRTEAPGSALPGESAEWSAAAVLQAGTACAVTATVLDGAGNSSHDTSPSLSAMFVPAAAATPSATVEAGQVGVVAYRGPDAGRAAVVLDGEAIALIDLYSAAASGPEVVYVADLTDGQHFLTVETTGSSDPASTGTGVAVEGFVTLAQGD